MVGVCLSRECKRYDESFFVQTGITHIDELVAIFYQCVVGNGGVAMVR